ncbi:MAG: thioesterase family protein [Wenzhouxiangellaceae bacterium]
MSQLAIEIDVQWGDQDAFGHVNSATFLRYLEEVRCRWMDSVPSHWQDGETGPVVANININYRRQLRWPERVRVTLKPVSPGRSSIKLESEISSADGDAPVLYADAVVTLVWIDRKTGEPVPLPGVIRQLA